MRTNVEPGAEPCTLNGHERRVSAIWQAKTKPVERDAFLEAVEMKSARSHILPLTARGPRSAGAHQSAREHIDEAWRV